MLGARKPRNTLSEVLQWYPNPREVIFLKDWFMLTHSNCNLSLFQFKESLKQLGQGFSTGLS